MTITTTQSTDIRNSYLVRLYSGTVRPEMQGDRLAVISYKVTKENNGKKPATRSVSIPAITLQVQPACLATALSEAFQKLQDARIRELIDEQLERDPTTASFSIPSHELTPESIAAWTGQKSNGERLTKADLDAWFTSDLEETLTLALARAVTGDDTTEPTSEQLSRITGAVEQHRKLLTGLAAPRVQLPDNIREQLSRAVALAPETTIRNKLSAKLTKQSEPEYVLGLTL